MITAEYCQRKAAEWVDRAEAASDPKTSSSMRRTSDAWRTLAQEVTQANFPRPLSRIRVRRPADLVNPRNDAVEVGIFCASAFISARDRSQTFRRVAGGVLVNEGLFSAEPLMDTDIQMAISFIRTLGRLFADFR